MWLRFSFEPYKRTSCRRPVYRASPSGSDPMNTDADYEAVGVGSGHEPSRETEVPNSRRPIFRRDSPVSSREPREKPCVCGRVVPPGVRPELNLVWEGGSKEQVIHQRKALWEASRNDLPGDPHITKCTLLSEDGDGGDGGHIIL
ncbi:hypothetical protein EYF80_039551 [Liparis tanakae]|uniref:Uncharacterized protein n=1 Tax=Liparis tanakae TaxID=230148 RepID=A0A4Z2G9N4_9TELE|nr:hypothetical protein EYF80_039551 [Liparis tanakae]